MIKWFFLHITLWVFGKGTHFTKSGCHVKVNANNIYEALQAKPPFESLSFEICLAQQDDVSAPILVPRQRQVIQFREALRGIASFSIHITALGINSGMPLKST